MKIVKKAFIKSLPVMAAYVVLGMGYGVLMSEKGYAPWVSILCSLVIFAGSMQYVAVDLFVTAASPISAAIMTVMVNGRHLFYGLSMIKKYRGMGWKKPYLIFSLTDETYSLLCDDADYPEKKDVPIYSFLVSLFDQCYWVLGTTLGAIAGMVLDINFEGIDFSMTALFVTVYVEQWLSSKDHNPALIGIGTSFLCLLLFGRSNFLIPAMLFITLFLSFPYINKKKAEEV